MIPQSSKSRTSEETLTTQLAPNYPESTQFNKAFCSFGTKRSVHLYRTILSSILLSTIFVLILLGCRKKDPIPTNREVVTNLYIHASDLPEEINCDQPFEYKKAKFMVRKPLDNERVDSTTNWPPVCQTATNRRDFPSVILKSTTALEIDISTYQGFKTIEIETLYSNYFNQKPSQVSLYDFNNKLIEKKNIPASDDMTKLSFQITSDNVKKVVIAGYAEVTFFFSLTLKSK